MSALSLNGVNGSRAHANGKPVQGVLGTFFQLDMANPVMRQPEDWDIKYDPDAVWPEVPIGLGLTVQIAWLTPELAKSWEGLTSENQRRTKSFHMKSLVRDLACGRWRLNGETMAFDRDGRLVQGEHRRKMVLAAGIPALVTIIRNVPPSVYATYDNTAKRSGADALRKTGRKHAKLVSAVHSLMVRYRLGAPLSNAYRTTPTETQELDAQFPDVEVSVEATTCFYGDFPRPSAFAMAHYVLSSVDAGASEYFFHHLHSGANMDETSPILKLNRRLFRDKNLKAYEVIHLIFKAWNLWRAGKTMKAKAQLRIGENESLPVPF